jgi:hypothetical protein
MVLSATAALLPLLAASERFSTYTRSPKDAPFSTLATDFMLQALNLDQPVLYESFGKSGLLLCSVPNFLFSSTDSSIV